MCPKSKVLHPSSQTPFPALDLEFGASSPLVYLPGCRRWQTRCGSCDLLTTQRFNDSTIQRFNDLTIQRSMPFVSQFADLPALNQVTVPDLWQQQAVTALRQGQDVVVQAPTGSGK